VQRKQREFQWNRACAERIAKYYRNRKDVGGVKRMLEEQKECWKNKRNARRIERMLEE
jgi:hypothetical protein